MYRLFNQIIDLVTGFDIDGTLKFVHSMDFWDREKINKYQQSQFQKLAKHALQSEFYKYYRDCELNKYPIVSKSVFQKGKDAFYTNHRKLYHKTTTSGSTGSPFSFPISKEMHLMKRVSHQKMLKWYGIPREARELKMGGIEASTKEKLYYILRNKRLLDINHFLNNDFERTYRIYNYFKPTVLYGYPSAIFDFISESANKGLPLFEPMLIVAHAENLYEYIYDKLTEVFPKSKIVNQYWATEANIGVSCPSGNIHIDEDTVICELINQDEDGIGDLIITNLFSYDFPLIRYKIDDRISISDEECSCGRKSRLIKSIKGREYDEINLANGKNIFLGSYYEIIKHLGKINQFQIIYIKENDDLNFLYKSTTGLSGEEQDYIIHFFQKRFQMTVQIKQVDELQYENSGKLKVHKIID